MKCPLCTNITKVINSRKRHSGIRARQRECTNCFHRFSTKEITLDIMSKLTKHDDETIKLINTFSSTLVKRLKNKKTIL